MLVQQLIEILKRYPPDMLVVLAFTRDGWRASPLMHVDRGKYVPLTAIDGSLFRVTDSGEFGSAMEEVVILRSRR